MIRPLAAAAVVGMVAAASPTPSPSLDTVLAAPPTTSFVPSTQSWQPVQGSFDAVDYLGLLTPYKPSRTLSILRDDGFVSGFGRAWIDQSAQHALQELVVAFAGGAGAKKWLPEARAIGQDSTYYKHDITVSGIDLQYGGHFANPAGPLFTDAIGFVKGNDYFFVFALSVKDDLGDLAATQARQQYDRAPTSTIPPAQWPENTAQGSSSAFSGGLSRTEIALGAAGFAALMIAAFVALLLVVRSGARRASQVVAGRALQMSPDGNYWWDGQAWRDASQSAPPAAQRSADGNYWWDGSKWRTTTRPPS